MTPWDELNDMPDGEVERVLRASADECDRDTVRIIDAGAVPVDNDEADMLNTIVKRFTHDDTEIFLLWLYRVRADGMLRNLDYWSPMRGGGPYMVVHKLVLPDGEARVWIAENAITKEKTGRMTAPDLVTWLRAAGYERRA